MFSEASVIAQQKMNVVKGNLIEVDTQLNNLSNELLSLRNVKTNQHGELEKQAQEKNFPAKIRDLIDENKALREKQRAIDD